MHSTVHFLFLLTPTLIALGLLGAASLTNHWTISLEQHLPGEIVLSDSSADVRLHSILLRVTVSSGLFSECIAYRNTTIQVSTSFDFRDEFYHPDRSNESCSDSQWMCRTGSLISQPLTHCIDRRQRCDRVVDCEDQSDEDSCNKHVPMMDCPVGSTRCLDGKSCYRKDEQTCDGISNCLDDSDEQNCTIEQCHVHRRVHCPRENRCAERENSYRCDGIVDCEDQSDEEHCDECRGEFNVFSCDSKCFLAKYRCDDTVQCSDFRDELNCIDYSNPPKPRRHLYHTDRWCVEERFDPFKVETFSADRPRDLILMSYGKLFVFYGTIGCLFFLFLSLLSLLFAVCRRCQCRNLSLYFYGLWMFAAFLLLCAALTSFVGLCFWKKMNVTDHQSNSPLDVMIHQRNPSLREVQFFGWSFWLACGAALATLLGFVSSCCVCWTMASARAFDKEYEIMQMDHY